MRFDSRVLILLGLLVFVLAPLTAPGYFVFGHDARHSVYFLQMFDQTLQDGAWYPRWAADMVFGYGYPLYIILAPLPFFAGEAFHLAGFDLVSAVKIVDGLAMLFSAITMYLFVSRVLNRNAGLVAGIAYVYIPYHLVDLTVRSAQAELLAFVFPPLIFWAFHQLATTRQARYAPFAALGYAGMLLSHMQTTVLFTPVIGLYLVVLFWSLRSTGFASRFALYAALAIGLALGLAAAFMLPVLLERRFLTEDPLIGGIFNYRKHFLNASQLFSPFWGYGYAGENGNDQFSLQLGLVPVLLTFVALSAWRRTSSGVRLHLTLATGLLAAVVLLVLPYSAPLWEPFTAIVAYVQFPWRLLILATFALAFLSGAALQAVSREARDLVPALALLAVLVTANYPYTEIQHTEAIFNHQTQMEFEVKDHELLGDTVWMTGARPQDSPLVAQYVSGQPLQKAVALDDGVSVAMISHGGQSTLVRVETSAPARILFYTRYFPGWGATVDGQPAALEPYDEQGLILVHVPAGNHAVGIRYAGTWAQRLGAILSGMSLIVTLLWIRFTYK